MSRLENAALRGNLQDMIDFLEQGDSPNGDHTDEESPLLSAIKMVRLSDEKDRSNRWKIVEVLLDKGADVNRFGNKHNYTALHHACQQGWLDMVNLLLSRNANVHALGTSISATPLEIVCESPETEKWKEIIKALISKGADPNRDRGQLYSRVSANLYVRGERELMRGCGITPPSDLTEFERMSLQVEMEKELKKDSASMNPAKFDAFFKEFKEKKAPTPTPANETEQLIRPGFLEYIDYLSSLKARKESTIFYQAQPDNKLNEVLKTFETDKVETALRRASAGFKNIALTEFKILIKNADINAQGEREGKTALHWAVEKNQLPYVQELISAGAKTEIQDQYGKKAIDYCIDPKIKEILTNDIASEMSKLSL